MLIATQLYVTSCSWSEQGLKEIEKNENGYEPVKNSVMSSHVIIEL